MTWLRVDDGFPEHHKIQALTDKAFRLHVTAMCSSARRLSDGHLSDLDVTVCRMVAGKARVNHVQELEQRGLWKRNGNGYLINDYLEYNPSAERVKEQRERGAERVRRHREGHHDNLPM